MSAQAVDPPEIAAVSVDLDDTLFPQQTWLAGAWQAVAAAGATLGLDAGSLLDRLLSIAAEGSDGGRIIDRALVAIGVSDVQLPALVPGLVAAFTSHAPEQLTCFDDVESALVAVRSLVPVACITDGDPHIQRAKLRALHLVDSFDAVVFSDELGRDHRKPSPAPFLRAADLLGVHPGAIVHVGDRPAKDVAGAAAVGMRAIRVRTGEYAQLPDDDAEPPWRTFDDAAAALRWLVQAIRGESPPDEAPGRAALPDRPGRQHDHRDFPAGRAGYVRGLAH